MANTQRYWDGHLWTDHISPTAGVAAAAPPVNEAIASEDTETDQDEPENAYVWTIAAIPLAWLPVTYFAPELAASWITIGAAAAITGTLAIMDERMLAQRGVTVDSFWGWVLPPLYLISRTRRARSTPAIPIIWFAVACLSILGMFTFASTYEFDGDIESPRIEDQLTSQGVVDARVSCPSETVHQGDALTCTLVERSGLVSDLLVTMSTDGTYSWQVAP